LDLGEFPIDNTFAICVDESERDLIREDELDVARMLVENGGASEWNISIVYGLLLSMLQSNEQSIPPALEYLYKQDRLPFDLNHPLNGYDREYCSALNIACNMGWTGARALKVLLACNVDPNSRDANGSTPLHSSCYVI
jgi:hypothetical protein